MFTGIVEELGKILSIGSSIKISAKKVLEDVHIGDSIAVNGICFTVTEFSSAHFSVDAMPETIHRTALQQLHIGSAVHLERAMSACGRFGGHIVSGHIDGTGKIIGYKNDGNAIWLTVSADTELLKYIAPKGSVAIDGVSLTVVDSLADSFTVSLIPHTSTVTTLTTHKVGDLVNIETDVLAKYVERLINHTPKNSTIDMDFLTRCGF
jgi:riboflavin synthase